MFAAKERPARVHGEDVLPNVERRLRCVGRRADACDVDEDVDVTRDSSNLRLFADVEVDVGPGEVRGHDLGALGREQACDRRADPRPRARDERAFAGEARHAIMRFCAVEIAVRANAKLAEGPRWDAAARRLLWVDIEGCKLHVLEGGEDRAIGLEAMVGAAAPTSAGAVLVALADRLALVDLADESVRTLVRLPHGPALRSNDGACDAAGRFWIGTMALDETPGAGALYRYDGSLERVLDGVTLSNGIGWTRDDTRMYYIDSPVQRVDLFDFELASGRVDDRRPFVSIDESDGIPDGLTVDDEGGVWVALYGGAASIATTKAAVSTLCSKCRRRMSPRAASAATTDARSS